MTPDPAAQAAPTPFEPVKAPNPSPPPTAAPAAPAGQQEASPGGAVSPEPGYTTTEFWVAVPVAAVGLLTLLGVVHLGSQQLQAIAGLTTLVAPSVAYVLGRSLRKAGLGG